MGLVSRACAALLLSGSVVGFAQAPPVTLESRVDAAGGGEAVITNRKSAPLTAYLLQVFLEPCNPSPRPDVFLAFDAAQTPGGTPLMPSKSRTEPLGTAHCNKVGNSVPGRAELKAAVYQDGTSFGDRRWVEAVIESRRSQLARIEAVLEALQTTTQPASGEAWAKQLDARLQTLRPERPELFSPLLDVRQLAMKDLSGPQALPGEQVGRVRILFEQLRDQLLTSSPRLR